MREGCSKNGVFVVGYCVMSCQRPNVLQMLVGNAGFGRSDNNPIINVHCSGESASQKGEFINNLLSLSFRIPEFANHCGFQNSQTSF